MTKRIVIAIPSLVLSLSVSAQTPIDEGKRLFDKGKYEESRAMFERALRSNPHDAVANYFVGRTYLEQAKFDQAEEYLEKAVETQRDSINYHLALATVYQEKARRASFISAPFIAAKWLRELETAFQLNDKNLEARRRLIQYYINAPGIGGGDDEKGKRLAEEMISIDEIQGRLIFAWALRRTGAEDHAIKQYEKILELDPENGSAYNSLGYVYLNRKDFVRAESFFRRCLEISPHSPNPHDCLGDYYLERGLVDDAITNFQKAIDLDPRFSESRFKLARTLATKKMNNEAILHL